MPGVVISTSIRTGPSTATVRESSQLFIVGLAERGPSDTATLIQSIAEYEDVYGEYESDSYTHPLVETFFEEGGTQCYVARTVGTSASAGSLTLQSGSVNVLALTANGPGAWSANVDIQVEQPTVGTTFRINVFYDDVIKYSTGVVSTVSQAAGRINSSAVATRYVSASVVSTSGIPSILAKTALPAGTDDRATVVDATHLAALELFSDSFGTGAVIAADSSSDAIAAGLVTHANNYDRVALLYGPQGDTPAQIKAMALSIQADEFAEHAALYYPWVVVPTPIQGVTRTIPPVGYVAGARSRAHNGTGPHAPYAGLTSASRFVLNTFTEVTKAVGDELDEGFVNSIRGIQNSVRIYGARSLSSDTDNFRYITQQDVVNSIVSAAYLSLEDLLFTPIDARGAVFAAVEAKLLSICANARDIGALYPAFNPANGTLLDPGFTVKCDRTINPVSQLQSGTIKARVGIRVSAIGDKIEIDIIKSNLTASVV
jgi:hypothetical protein